MAESSLGDRILYVLVASTDGMLRLWNCNTKLLLIRSDACAFRQVSCLAAQHIRLVPVVPVVVVGAVQLHSTRQLHRVYPLSNCRWKSCGVTLTVMLSEWLAGRHEGDLRLFIGIVQNTLRQCVYVSYNRVRWSSEDTHFKCKYYHGISLFSIGSLS